MREALCLVFKNQQQNGCRVFCSVKPSVKQWLLGEESTHKMATGTPKCSLFVPKGEKKPPEPPWHPKAILSLSGLQIRAKRAPQGSRSVFVWHSSQLSGASGSSLSSTPSAFSKIFTCRIFTGKHHRDELNELKSRVEKHTDHGC